MQRTKAQQLAALEDSRQLGDLMSPLMDPKVQAEFNKLEEAITAALCRATTGDPSKLAALSHRLSAFREVRAFISAAVTGRESLTKRIAQLTEVKSDAA